MTNSYNGWPAPAPNLNTKFGASVGAPAFGSGGYAGGMAAGDVTTVMAYLIGRLHNEVEPMMKDPNTGQLGYGCWGYSYRDNVNNPGQLSNHASATAIDYNAPRHPNNTSTGPNGGGGWTGAQYRQIMDILNGPLQGSVNWLTQNDPMHFDIRVNASQLAKVAASLGGSIPPVPVPPDDWFDMATRQDLDDAIMAAIPAIAVAVWTQNVSDRPANDLLNSAAVNAERAAAGIGDLPVNVWTTAITDDTDQGRANALLARAAGPA
jgi:hypothetical protein